MFKEITAGEHTLTLRSSGLTPILFKQVFHKDIIQMLSEVNDENVSVITDSAPELAYIMNMQAEKADLTQLSYEKYLEWVDQFEALDLPGRADEIVNVYISNQQTSAKPKKKVEKQSDK